MIPLRVLNVVGSRRNFIKIASIMAAIAESREVEGIVVHTGRHYEDLFSSAFFRDLGLPEPGVVLDVESRSHAKQTAAIMERFEDTVYQTLPDLVIVAGDSNSTVAASMTAVKMGVPVAHYEAGLRSFDRETSEEINRLMTDAISNFHFVTEESALNNLICEGIPPSRIHFVGNVLMATLGAHSERILASTVVPDLSLEPGGYAVLALKRFSNGDKPQRLHTVIDALERIQKRLPIVFPARLETVARLHELGVWERIEQLPGLMIVDPPGYLDFAALLKGSAMVLTDTSGVQEETTVLQVPCLTLRNSTERLATVSEGTNTLVGQDAETIVAEALRALRGDGKHGRVPPMWDGQAPRRIVTQILRKREEILTLYRRVRVKQPCTAITGLAR